MADTYPAPDGRRYATDVEQTPGGPAAQRSTRHRPITPFGISLFDFKCAWFNEHQYCEFFPRTTLKAGR